MLVHYQKKTAKQMNVSMSLTSINSQLLLSRFRRVDKLYVHCSIWQVYYSEEV